SSDLRFDGRLRVRIGRRVARTCARVALEDRVGCAERMLTPVSAVQRAVFRVVEVLRAEPPAADALLASVRGAEPKLVALAQSDRRRAARRERLLVPGRPGPARSEIRGRHVL